MGGFRDSIILAEASFIDRPLSCRMNGVDVIGSPKRAGAAPPPLACIDAFNDAMAADTEEEGMINCWWQVLGCLCRT